MSILENISLWGGVAGVVVSIFAIIIVYLTRSNIIDLLDKDVIMYDKVYEIKKNAFCSAFDVLDYYEIYGVDVKNSKQFVQKAKTVYNDLMCVSNTPKIYEEFYKLTLDPSTTKISQQDIANFKDLCRHDLGLHIKKKKNSKKVADTTPIVSQINTVSPTQNAGGRTIAPQPAQVPSRPAPRPMAPTQGTPAPQPRPQAPQNPQNPQNPM